ncbi:MAG TPA: MBL fold metallo-hydrolase [Chitinophagaceae bacterium]|nr:MBL fold metallo-hydrolase [Chitinophagaceae bacterium]
MKIIPLSEGTFTIDKSKLFVPFDESKDVLKERTSGSLLVEIQPFVVITSKDILLLDAGLGFQQNGEMQLRKNLMDAGINPADITKVLVSHLHKDHAGGLGEEKEGLGARLSLPNATYYVQQDELAFAFEKGYPSFITEELECLRNNSRVYLLEGNGFIDNYIEYKVTKAHSPHHQVFWIRDEEKIIFFGADDAPQLHQMKHRFVAKYDFDGKKAMELRQQWWEQGAKEKWTFLFYHDVKNPVWRS